MALLVSSYTPSSVAVPPRAGTSKLASILGWLLHPSACGRQVAHLLAPGRLLFLERQKRQVL